MGVNSGSVERGPPASGPERVCFVETKLTVDVLAMPNLDNADNQTHIGDRIDDPIRSLADAILVIKAGKFFTAGRSRIGGKLLNALDNAETVFLGG